MVQTLGRVSLAVLFGLICIAVVPGFGPGATDHVTASLTLSAGPAETLDESVPPSATPGLSPEVQRLAGDLSRLVDRAGDWGILAVSLTTGDTLVSRGAETPMAPASNVKLLTSAGALHHLGPDHRFSTWLLADGPSRDGVLEGDLILYGTGDPTLGLRNPDRPTGALLAFVDALRSEGIHEIRGDVIGDGTYFRGDPRRPSWNPDDLNDWFAAPVAALSFNENMISIQVRARGPVGMAPQWTTHPNTSGLPVRNAARLVGGGTSDPLAIVRSNPDDPIEIRGDLPVGSGDQWRSMSVSDPSHYAASVLVTTLEAAGIRVRGQARSRSAVDASAEGFPDNSGSPITGALHFGSGSPSSLRTVAIHQSPKLPELLHTINHRSHNLFAESLILSLGRALEGDPSFEGGSRALSSYLTEVVGLSSESFHIEDGSGLSRLNRASPAALVGILAHMQSDPHGELFHASLPEAGQPRGLSRMHRTAAAGNLRAKTGTIHRTSALSGIVRTAGGERVLFSIVANDVPSPWAAKRVEDQFGVYLASFARQAPVGAEPSSVGGHGATSRAVNDRR